MDMRLITAFPKSHKFRHVVFSFPLNSRKNLMSFFHLFHFVIISFLNLFSISSELFSFYKYVSFPLFLLLLISGKMQRRIPILLYLWRLALHLSMQSVLNFSKFNELLRIRYIILCLLKYSANIF